MIIKSRDSSNYPLLKNNQQSMEIENISYKRTLVDLASLSPQSNQSQINSPSC